MLSFLDRLTLVCLGMFVANALRRPPLPPFPAPPPAPTGGARIFDRPPTEREQLWGWSDYLGHFEEPE